MPFFCAHRAFEDPRANLLDVERLFETRLQNSKVFFYFNLLLFFFFFNLP